MSLRRLLPLFLALVMAFASVAPAHAEEPIPGLSLEMRGDAVVGGTLHGALFGQLVGDVITATWSAEGVEVHTPTKPSLLVDVSLLGQVISLEVVVEREGFSAVTLTAQSDGAVLPGTISSQVYLVGHSFFPGDSLTVVVQHIQPGVAVTHQWLAEEKPIQGATSSVLVLTAAMAGQQVSVSTTLSKRGYTTLVKSQDALGAVRSAKVSPGTLRLEGEARAGSVITARSQSWLPEEGLSLRHEWLLDGKVLPRLGDNMLFLRPEWQGRRILIRVTGSRNGLQSSTLTSTAQTILSAVGNNLPSVSVGYSTTANLHYASELDWPRGTAFSYQWVRFDANGRETLLQGATSSSYRLGAADSFRVGVILTGTTPDGQSMVVRSLAGTSASDVYTITGEHSFNGREWRTTCEPYSQTKRCRTEIWATQVHLRAGRYVSVNGWVFNSLTYDFSPAKLWAGNPLARPGSWTAADGRKWKTECFATTLPHLCRSYAWSSYIASEQTRSGWRHFPSQGWVFNNQVRLR